jgi:hypothetical protein
MKNILIIFGIIIGSSLLTSCSITQGSIVPSTHYVYPNSNVTPLGATSAQVKKFGILFPPGFKAKDLDKLYGDALSKHAGADLILDSKVDSKNTFLMIFHFMTVSISGTAAKMEVGKQDIGQNNFVPSNSEVAPVTVTDGNVNQQVTTVETASREVAKVSQPVEPARPKVKLNGPRIGLHVNMLDNDLVKNGYGVSGEFFVAKNSSLATGVNYFYPRRSDLGFGYGTYETNQVSIYLDSHNYLLNRVVGLYLITGFSYDFYKFDKFESPYSFTDNFGELGGHVGLGLNGSFFSKKVIPFAQAKYYQRLVKPEYISEDLETGGLRLSFGLKYAFGNN